MCSPDKQKKQTNRKPILIQSLALIIIKLHDAHKQTVPVIVSNFAMFYSHTQARAKLPKKRRRIMPVEHLPRSLAIRSNPNQLQHSHGPGVGLGVAGATHRTAGPGAFGQAPATLAASGLAGQQGAYASYQLGSGQQHFDSAIGSSNFSYYAPGAGLGSGSSNIQHQSSFMRPTSQHQSGLIPDRSLSSLTASGNNLDSGNVFSVGSAGGGSQMIRPLVNQTLVPRGATLDHPLHARTRINLSNKDLLPDCPATATATVAATPTPIPTATATAQSGQQQMSSSSSAQQVSPSPTEADSKQVQQSSSSSRQSENKSSNRDFISDKSCDQSNITQTSANKSKSQSQQQKSSLPASGFQQANEQQTTKQAAHCNQGTMISCSRQDCQYNVCCSGIELTPQAGGKSNNPKNISSSCKRSCSSCCNYCNYTDNNSKENQIMSFAESKECSGQHRSESVNIGHHHSNNNNNNNALDSTRRTLDKNSSNFDVAGAKRQDCSTSIDAPATQSLTEQQQKKDRPKAKRKQHENKEKFQVKDKHSGGEVQNEKMSQKVSSETSLQQQLENQNSVARNEAIRVQRDLSPTSEHSNAFGGAGSFRDLSEFDRKDSSDKSTVL